VAASAGDRPLAEQGGVVADRTDRELERLARGAEHGEPVARGQVLLLGDLPVDHDLARLEVGDGARRHPEREDLLGGGGVHRADDGTRLLAVGELDLADHQAEGGDGVDALHVGQVRRQFRRCAVEGEPVGGLDDEVALEALADRTGDGGLGGAGEHRDEAHERDAHDEGGGGGCRAARVAHGVLAGQRAGDALDRRQPRPDGAGERSGHHRAQHDHADHQQTESCPHRGQVAAGQLAAQRGPDEQAGQHQAQQAGTGPDPRGVGPVDGDVAQGGQRRHPGGPDRGHEGGDGGHAETHRHGQRRRAGLDHQAGLGDVDVEGVEQHEGPGREQHAADEAHDRREHADEQRLQQHRAEDLAPPGSDGPHQGQLAGALGHQDAEGVGDDEPTHEQGDEGEHQQSGGEEAERLLDLAGRLVRELLAGDHVGAGHQVGLAQRGDQLLRGDAGFGQHLDLVHLALFALEALRGGQGGAHEDGTAGRVRLAEPGDAHEGELLGSLGADQRDLVAQGEPALVDPGPVDDDLAVGLGGPPAGHLVRVERGLRGPGTDHGGRTGAADGVARRVEQREVEPGHRSFRRRHPRDVADLGHERLRDEVAHRAAEVALEQLGAAHHGVDALTQVAEQVVEDPAQGGVEHEGAGHEGHTQDHRHAGGDETALVGPERAEGGAEHGSLTDSGGRGACGCATRRRSS
jgi:hypothetical protein